MNLGKTILPFLNKTVLLSLIYSVIGKRKSEPEKKKTSSGRPASPRSTRNSVDKEKPSVMRLPIIVIIIVLR